MARYILFAVVFPIFIVAASWVTGETAKYDVPQYLVYRDQLLVPACISAFVDFALSQKSVDVRATCCGAAGCVATGALFSLGMAMFTGLSWSPWVFIVMGIKGFVAAFITSSMMISLEKALVRDQK